MEPSLDFLKNNGITNDIFDILINSRSIYFNAKGLRFELFRKYGVSLRGRPPSSINVYNNDQLKMIVSTKIGHILRKLKKLGYIKKISSLAWKIVKEINPKLKESLYTTEERKKQNDNHK